MTAESDFRENTRATKDLAKKIEGLTKVLQSLDRKLSATPVEESFVGLVKGDSIVEAVKNIKNFAGLSAICHTCFAGMCKPGVVFNDGCNCCNKSHRKTS